MKLIKPLLLALSLFAVVYLEAKEVHFYPNKISASEIPTIKLSPQTVDSLIAIEESNQSSLLYRFAVSVIVDLHVDKCGIWKVLDDSSLVWYCKVYSKSAYSLRPEFVCADWPKGTQLRIFNPSQTQVETMTDSSSIIQPVAGNMIIIELYLPAGVKKKDFIHISTVAHDYKDFFNVGISKRGVASSCNIDINCSDADKWQLEKRSVCKIFFPDNNVICTGTLLNNTSNDQTPYVITADHCLSSPMVTKAVFYFNSESDSCGKRTSTKLTDTVKGAEVVAGSLNHELDFGLLKLSRKPASQAMPYYAGWSISENTPKQVVTIHHPNGDLKKYSESYPDSVQTGSLNLQTYTKPNVHWRIVRWKKGTTERGSSGAGLFDANTHLLIGTLSGGDASCEYPVNDYYAKLSVNWQYYASAANQLKPWLDPLNSEATECPGLDIYKTSLNPTTNIYATDTLIVPTTGSYNRGMWTGANNMTMTSIAERFAGLTNRYICAIKFPIAMLSNTSVLGKVIFKIWNGTQTPTQVLYAHELNESMLSDGKNCFIKLPYPVRTGTIFFVGFSFENLLQQDDFTVFATKNRRNNENSLYGQLNGVWGAFKEMGYASSLGMELYSSPLEECLDTITQKAPVRFSVPQDVTYISYPTKELFSYDSLQNFDEHKNYLLSNFFSEWGYTSGTNGYKFTAFADRIKVNDNKYINSIKVAFARTIPLDDSAKIRVSLWKSDKNGIINPVAIFSKQMLISSLKNDYFNVISIPRPLYIDSVCYAGISVDSPQLIDTMAVYQSADTVTLSKSYYFCNNQWLSYSLANVKYKLAIGVGTSYSSWYIGDREPISYYKLPAAVQKNMSVKNDVSLFPNPITRDQYLKIHIGNVKVFDTISAKIQTVDGQVSLLPAFNVDRQTGTAEIDISAFHQGIYFISVMIDGDTYIKKLIIY